MSGEVRTSWCPATLAKQVGVGLKDIDRLMLEMEANWQSLEPYKHVKVTPEMRARFVGAWKEHQERHLRLTRC